MHFIINMDTGNIEYDVIKTIENFNEEELTKLIDAIKLKIENDNLVGESIFFKYPDYDNLFKTARESKQISIETRKMIRNRICRLDSDSILTAINNSENIKSKIVSIIIEKLKNKINIQEKIINAIINDKYNNNFYNLCLKIISTDEYFNKYINYNENIDVFGTKYSQKEYLLEISKLLGYQEKEIEKNNPIYKYQIITEQMKTRYLKLRNIINIDIDLLEPKVFDQEGKKSLSKEEQEKIDNDWQIHPKMYEYIMNDMDPEYTDLEKISHIYLKLCQVLRYNMGYHIKKWTTAYNKERQESITPENNEIICSEFTYIATNIISKLNSSIEARCIITGQNQHMSLGILDREKNIRINFDSTIIENEFDDLGRIKLGLPLVGIKYICDRKHEFENAFNKVYRRLCMNSRIETIDLIDAYEKLQKNKEIEIDVYENLCIFFDKMKEKNVVGSELLGAFKRMVQQGFFGNIKYAIVGEDKTKTFAERQTLSTPQDILNGLEENIIIQLENEYYLLRLNDCKILPMSIDELNMLFQEDKMAYFNPKYSLEGIGAKTWMSR